MISRPSRSAEVPLEALHSVDAAQPRGKGRGRQNPEGEIRQNQREGRQQQRQKRHRRNDGEKGRLRRIDRDLVIADRFDLRQQQLQDPFPFAQRNPLLWYTMIPQNFQNVYCSAAAQGVY